MEVLKKIARKILADEIKKLKEECDKTKSWNDELLDKMSAFKNECESKASKAQNEKNIAERKAQEFEKENDVLRRYYDLGVEPSEEIKAKMHIDLEINRLKEENLKLIAIKQQPICIPVQQYYPYYGFGRGFI